MRKLILAIMCVFGVVSAYATGENERVTSMGYVTEELADRQDKFDKLGADTAVTYSGSNNGEIGSRAIAGDLGAESNTTNTAIPTVGAVDTKLDNKQDKLDFAANTVLMNTGTDGAPAAKGIYDDSDSYATQQDSLIDAATFNAALQNAINSELSCAQRKDPNDPTSKCLLFNIFAPTPQTLLPTGYTPLEYIETTGTQYIVLPTFADASNIDITVDVLHTNGTDEQILFSATRTTSIQFLYTISSTWRAWISGLGNHAVTEDIQHRHKFLIKTTSSGVEYYVDGVKNTNVPTNLYTSSEFSNKTPKLGARTRGDGAADYFWQGKIYAFNATCNGTVCMNLIPAIRHSDNAIGMYDTVSNTFRENAGTGTFTAGPISNAFNLYIPQNQ